MTLFLPLLSPMLLSSPRLRALLLGLAMLALGGCSSDYQWGWHILDPTLESGRNNLRFLMWGYSYTIGLTLVSMFFSLLLGVILVLVDMTKIGFLQRTVQCYLAVFRAIPILVLIMWVYYGLPVVMGISFTPFVAAVIALALADAAFEAEVLRGGIQSIDQGQLDAADSLGLRFDQKFRLIILPQALRVVLPTLVNQSVYMLKMSSLASFIGLADLTRKATELVVTAYRPLEIYSFLVLEYLLLILLMTWFAKRLEKKMQRGYVR